MTTPAFSARTARMPASQAKEFAMINLRFGRQPQDLRSRPARRRLRWLEGIECLESRVGLASSGSFSLAGSALSVISTTAQIGHFTPHGFGDLKQIGRHPATSIGAPGAGHFVGHGYGDLKQIGRVPIRGSSDAGAGHFAPNGFGDLGQIGRLPVTGVSTPGAGHFAADGYGDLKLIGRVPIRGSSAPGAGHFAPNGFGDLAQIGRVPVVGSAVPQTGHIMPNGFGDLARGTGHIHFVANAQNNPLY
jgi:hypothetical protein